VIAAAPIADFGAIIVPSLFFSGNGSSSTRLRRTVDPELVVQLPATAETTSAADDRFHSRQATEAHDRKGTKPVTAISHCGRTVGEALRIGPSSHLDDVVVLACGEPRGGRAAE
jgi:hypothetical protein